MEASQVLRVAVAGDGLVPLDVKVHALSPVMDADWDQGGQGLRLDLLSVRWMPYVKQLDVEEVMMWEDIMLQRLQQQGDVVRIFLWLAAGAVAAVALCIVHLE